MNATTHSRTYALPRRFPIGSLSEAVRVIEESMLTQPIPPARLAHIKRTLDGLANLRRAGGL